MVLRWTFTRALLAQVHRGAHFIVLTPLYPLSSFFASQAAQVYWDGYFVSFLPSPHCFFILFAASRPGEPSLALSLAQVHWAVILFHFFLPLPFFSSSFAPQTAPAELH